MVLPLKEQAQNMKAPHNLRVSLISEQCAAIIRMDYKTAKIYQRQIEELDAQMKIHQQLVELGVL